MVGDGGGDRGIQMYRTRFLTIVLRVLAEEDGLIANVNLEHG